MNTEASRQIRASLKAASDSLIQELLKLKLD